MRFESSGIDTLPGTLCRRGGCGERHSIKGESPKTKNEESKTVVCPFARKRASFHLVRRWARRMGVSQARSCRSVSFAFANVELTSRQDESTAGMTIVSRQFYFASSYPRAQRQLMTFSGEPAGSPGRSISSPSTMKASSVGMTPAVVRGLQSGSRGFEDSPARGSRTPLCLTAGDGRRAGRGPAANCRRRHGH